MPRKSSELPSLLHTLWKSSLAKVFDKDLFALLSSDINNIALIEQYIKELYIWVLQKKNNDITLIQEFFKNLIWSICGEFVWSFDTVFNKVIAWASLQWKRFLNNSKKKLWALWNIRVSSDDYKAIKCIFDQLTYSLAFPEEKLSQQLPLVWQSELS